MGLAHKVKKNTSASSLSVSPHQKIRDLEVKIEKLSGLVDTVSRGKYMWEATFDAITDPVMIVSSDYIIRRANRAAAREALVDVRKLIGTKCYENLAGFSRPCRGCPLQTTLKTGKPHSFILDPFTKSNRQHQVNAYRLGEESNAEVVLHYRDLTEEKELERQLIQSEKMAAIGMLAGGVAHEINNPLGGILAFTQLILREVNADHPSYHDLQEIEASALRCKRIVQDLLDFSRQNRDDAKGPVNLNDVLQKILPIVQMPARTNHIEISSDFSDQLPEIRGNFYKLQQVFLNLITNAFHAMPKGGVIQIRTSFLTKEHLVVVEIQDTGEGISPEHIGKIFDPYFTTKKTGEGTGLGLSITYGIVKEHQGSISVRSRPGEGTVFTVSFPIAI